MQSSRPSFFVAIDYSKKKIVLTIRNTESKCLSGPARTGIKRIPNVDPSLGWFGHEVRFTFNKYTKLF